MSGLLADLSNPIRMAEIEERRQQRKYIVGRIAQETGLTREEAADSLMHFELVADSFGQALH